MYPGICQSFSATHPFGDPNIDLEQLTFSYRIVVSFPGLPLMDLSDLIPTFQSFKVRLCFVFLSPIRPRLFPGCFETG